MRLVGSDTVNDDGYVMDFGEIKAVVKGICKSWNELFLLPMESDALLIEEVEGVSCLGAAFCSSSVRTAKPGASRNLRAMPFTCLEDLQADV